MSLFASQTMTNVLRAFMNASTSAIISIAVFSVHAILDMH